MKAKKTQKKKLLHKLGRGLKDHLLPHPGNKHVPHVLKHRALFGYSVILILLKVLVISTAIAFPTASLFSSAITPSNIVSLTNETRETLELPTLTANQKLAIAAQMKAEDMLANQYFAHTSPTGVTPWKWFGDAGYKYRYAGENLAVYFSTAETVHDGWLASPTHRANIVDARYTEIGIGVAQGNYKDYPAIFVVQLFGYPASATAVATTTTPEPEPTPSTPPNNVLAAVDSEPAPEPAPIAVASAPTPTTPKIDETSIVVTPNESNYNLELAVNNASSVTAHLGTESTTLTKTDTGTWSGSVAYDANTLGSGGEQLYVVASNDKQEEVVEPVALVAPQTNAQQLYAFNQNTDSAKIFGFIKVNNLNDSVRQFYIYTMIFLGTMLALTLMAKLHAERLPLVVHSVAVIALALLLSMF